MMLLCGLVLGVAAVVPEWGRRTMPPGRAISK